MTPSFPGSGERLAGFAEGIPERSGRGQPQIRDVAMPTWYKAVGYRLSAVVPRNTVRASPAATPLIASRVRRVRHHLSRRRQPACSAVMARSPSAPQPRSPPRSPLPRGCPRFDRPRDPGLRPPRGAELGRQASRPPVSGASTQPPRATGDHRSFPPSSARRS
jgi:hypothetical protein